MPEINQLNIRRFFQNLLFADHASPESAFHFRECAYTGVCWKIYERSRMTAFVEFRARKYRGTDFTCDFTTRGVRETSRQWIHLPSYDTRFGSHEVRFVSVWCAILLESRAAWKNIQELTVILTSLIFYSTIRFIKRETKKLHQRIFALWHLWNRNYVEFQNSVVSIWTIER